MSMLSNLPAPSRSQEYLKPVPVALASSSQQSTALIMQGKAGTRAISQPIVSLNIPPYGQRVKQRFIPRNQEDFGDGGAFPEIHIMQYPLDMGRKDKVWRGVVVLTIC